MCSHFQIRFACVSSLRLQLEMLTRAFAQDLNGCQNIPSSLPQRERRQSQVTTATALLKATIWAEAILLQLLPLTISKTVLVLLFLLKCLKWFPDSPSCHLETNVTAEIGGKAMSALNVPINLACLCATDGVTICQETWPHPSFTRTPINSQSKPFQNLAHFLKCHEKKKVELLFWSLNLLLLNRWISQT